VRILAIRGKNLASLAEPFDVDLAAPPLGGCGVFALSGPTGAGKSTILDALSLALFGSTPRLERALRVNVPDPSGQAMPSNSAGQLLRRGAGSGHAEAEFIGIDGQVYRARYSLRRANGRPNGKPQPPIHELFLRDDAQPCGGNNSETQLAIVEKLGLDARQFTRAVLLAQNEFAAFLSSNADERAALLETLTGTEQFGQLSQRAFERAKAERSKLERIDAELGATPVLAEEEQMALDGQAAQLTSHLEILERQVLAIAAKLGYERRSQELLARVAATALELEERQRQSEALAPEQVEVARLRCVMFEAKELVEALQQAGRERQRLQHLLDEQAHLVEAATAEVQRQRQAEQIASEQLTAARARDLEFRPRLRQAEGLDHELAQLNLASDEQRATLNSARAKYGLLEQEHSAATTQLSRVGRGQEELSDWFDSNAALGQLVEGWQSKREALGRALLRHEHLQADQARLAKLDVAVDAGQTRLGQLSATVAGLEAAMCTLHANAEALHATVVVDNLDELECIERAAERSLSGHDELTGWVEESVRFRADANACKVRDEQERTRLTELQRAREQQSEKAQQLRQVLQQKALELRGAERMAGQSAEALRAVLCEGEPCPVCGSNEHPLGGKAIEEVSARLRASLVALNEETTQLQQELLQQERLEQASSADVARLEERVAANIQTIRTLNDLVAGVNERLAAYAEFARLVSVSEPERQAALGQRREQLVVLLDAAKAARVQAKQRAIEAEQARIRAEQSAKEYALTETERLSVERAQTELERHQLGQKQTVHLLQAEQSRDLEPLGAWRQRWDEAPQSCLECVDAAVAKWQGLAAKRSALAQQRTELSAQIPTIERLQGELSKELQRAEERLALTSTMLEAKRGARLLLFEGRSVEAVETDLDALMQQTSATFELARSARATSEQDVALVVAQSRATAEALLQAEAAHQMRDSAVEGWLTSKREFTPEFHLEREELQRLIECGPTTIVQIEARLERARSSADLARGGFEQAVVARDAHVAQADDVARAFDAAVGSRDRADLAMLLDTVTRERESVRDDRAKVLATRTRDEELRQIFGQKRLDRELQRAVVERWQLLSNLIGSADGKKLRHLAQEVTLDLVIVHANQHLRDLARRYWLERLPESLHIVVIDHELLGERRSVASLSGGETFLVSLALALGLASLSAEKIRVETLFIDEGFGSLDQATLQLAVAALDRVQASGRQVGVVSHVGDLAERLGVEVRVEPLGGGKSRVRVLSRH